MKISLFIIACIILILAPVVMSGKADVLVPGLKRMRTGTLSKTDLRGIRIVAGIEYVLISAATLAVALLIAGLGSLSRVQIDALSTSVANILLFLIIMVFILAGVRRRINVYDAFIDGAKEGFQTAVRIIPYLVAILVGIGVFRASGTMDMLVDGIAWVVSACGGDTDFVGALPTALMKPLSGSGARGLMVDAMTTYGADSFVGRLACIFQGSTDTTFYILAIYFGSVGIRHTRHAVACGLLADLAGVIAAIGMAYLFFGS